jgi:hypothetical protein
MEIATPRGPFKLLGNRSGAELFAGTDSGWDPRPADVQVSFDQSIKIAVRFATIDANAGDQIFLSFRFLSGDAVLARYPADHAICVRVPDASFEAENWSA